MLKEGNRLDYLIRRAGFTRLVGEKRTRSPSMCWLKIHGQIVIEMLNHYQF